jgi:DNA polymerase-3 subunit epsilon
MFKIFESIKNNINRANLKDSRFDFLFEKDESGELVVLDTETTGLDTKTDEILSIAAVKIKDNKILTSQSFEIYLKSTKELEAKNIEIHKIRPCDLKEAYEPYEAIVKLLEFIGSRTLVGYYLEFDIAMLNRYTRELLGINLPNKTIEVSELYFDKTIALIPQGNIDLSFDKILQNCNVPNMGVHNALNDAIMSAMIYLNLTLSKQKRVKI